MSTSLRPREYALIALSVVVAAVCVRLGIWQLHRLHERRVYNAAIAARLWEAPVPVAQLPHDSASVYFRQAIVHGVYDYAHQFVLADRTRNGSPGVYILTPVRLMDTGANDGRAVLVNRGWVYAADGVNADLSKWREADTVNAVGYAEPLASHRSGVARLPTHPGAYRWMDTTVVRTAVPYPVLPYILVLRGDSAQETDVGRPNDTRAGTPPAGAPSTEAPPRVPAPVLDEGPHQSYAIQWFSFAAIALVGAWFFVRRQPSAGERLPVDQG